MSHAGVVFSTLLVVWLSVLLVRLLGQAANGDIGASVVFGLAAFSSITALPVILAVSLFIAVLTTVTRNFRESEMVVWFASGISLQDWVRPVLRCAVPVAVMVAALTLFASPWASRQIVEYQQRYQQRSDVSKISAGQFIETNDGARVFFANSPGRPGDDLGRVIARVIGPEWLSIFTASSVRVEQEPDGDRFLVLGPGRRYDIKPGKPDFRLFDFQKYGFRLERKGNVSPEEAQARAEREMRARPTLQLFHDNNRQALGQIMWRVSLPLAALNLALLAIPLGSVNPRLGRSGDLLIAGLVGLLYMNMMNLSQRWIESNSLSFWEGMGLVHGSFFVLMMYLMWRKLRVKAPRPPKPATVDSSR